MGLLSNDVITNICPCPGHSDGTLSSGHSMHVTIRPNTHGGSYRQVGLLTFLYGPLHLLNVLKILKYNLVYFILNLLFYQFYLTK